MQNQAKDIRRGSRSDPDRSAPRTNLRPVPPGNRHTESEAAPTKPWIYWRRAYRCRRWPGRENSWDIRYGLLTRDAASAGCRGQHQEAEGAFGQPAPGGFRFDGT